MAKEFHYTGFITNLKTIIPVIDSFPRTATVYYELGNKGAHIKYGNRQPEEVITTPIASDLPRGLKFGQWNVHSLPDKYDQLKVHFKDPGKEFDVLGISETWLNENHEDQHVKLRGYNMLRQDRRAGARGGVCMYIVDKIPFVPRSDLQNNNVEGVWAELTLPHSPHILVATIYRPSDSKVEWYQYFEDMYETAYLESKEIVIMGDINIDFWLKIKYRKILKDILDAF